MHIHTQYQDHQYLVFRIYSLLEYAASCRDHGWVHRAEAIICLLGLWVLHIQIVCRIQQAPDSIWVNLLCRIWNMGMGKTLHNFPYIFRFKVVSIISFVCVRRSWHRKAHSRCMETNCTSIKRSKSTSIHIRPTRMNPIWTQDRLIHSCGYKTFLIRTYKQNVIIVLPYLCQYIGIYNRTNIEE